MGKLLVIVGLAIAGLGLLVMAGIPFGRLPGDIVYRRGNFTAYVPIATSLALSLLLAVLLALFRR
jgi:hypothetical protein